MNHKLSGEIINNASHGSSIDVEPPRDACEKLFFQTHSDSSKPQILFGPF